MKIGKRPLEGQGSTCLEGAKKEGLRLIRSSLVYCSGLASWSHKAQWNKYLRMPLPVSFPSTKDFRQKGKMGRKHPKNSLIPIWKLKENNE